MDTIIDGLVCCVCHRVFKERVLIGWIQKDFLPVHIQSSWPQRVETNRIPRRRMAMEVHVDRYGMDAMALYNLWPEAFGASLLAGDW